MICFKTRLILLAGDRLRNCMCSCRLCRIGSLENGMEAHGSMEATIVRKINGVSWVIDQQAILITCVGYVHQRNNSAFIEWSSKVTLSNCWWQVEISNIGVNCNAGASIIYYTSTSLTFKPRVKEIFNSSPSYELPSRNITRHFKWDRNVGLYNCQKKHRSKKRARDGNWFGNQVFLITSSETLTEGNMW